MHVEIFWEDVGGDFLVDVGGDFWVDAGGYFWVDAGEDFWVEIFDAGGAGRDHCRQLPALSWADTITWLSWGIGKKMQKIKFWALGKLVLVKRYQANSWLKRDHYHQIPLLASQTKLQKYSSQNICWQKRF